MQKILISYVLLLNVITLFCQNLIPNSGFDELDCPDNPINSIESTSNWYATGADVYWIHLNCPVDLAATQSILAIKPQISPFFGFGYISLEGALTANGYFITEGVGVRLKEMLKPGTAYFFEMAAMNYDAQKGQEHPDLECGDLLKQSLAILVEEEPITLGVTRSGSGSYVSDLSINGEIVLSDESALRTGFKTNKWYSYFNCFIANGGEQHLAISGSNFKVAAANDCIEEAKPGTLFRYGHALDEIQLVEIPQKIDTTLILCELGEMVDLDAIVDGPFVRRATFLWEDGYEGGERSISQEGQWKVNMVLPCITVPINLKVEVNSCEATIYVPNAFSPNGDGVNDELQPFVRSLWPVKTYHLQIYNRWGQLIFQTSDINRGWDGRFEDQLLSEGIYLWHLEYALEDSNQSQFSESGDFMLLK